MRSSASLAGAVFVLSTLVNARPNPQADKLFNLFKRTLTPDNTCGLVGAGNNNGYSCDPSLAQGGPCCSQNGYCGSSVAYCGTGCQSAYGNCTAPSTTTTSSSPTSSPTGVVISTNEQCGKANGNTTCPMGQCCSINGYCAADAAHCQSCQPAYSQNSTCVASGSGDVCGPSNGNAVCPGNECCSAAGYCGTTEDYCADPQCQPLFGTCDSDMTPAGPSTINDPRPQLGSVTYSDDINDCIQNNVVAFTFDDGPYNYTSHILDILKSYGAQATFFITGNNVGKGPIDTTSPYPALIQRMYQEGHQIASHTWSHYDLSNITHDMRMQQMVKNERALANILGFYPTYMRPPYSDCTAESGCEADMQALGYHRTYFDLDTQDYLNDASNLIQNSKNIVDDALFGSENADSTDYLSIMHDIHYQTAYNLTEFFLQELKKKGWKAVAVGTCLNDPVANWYRYPANSTSTSSIASQPTSSPTSSFSTTTSILTTSSVVLSTSTTSSSTTSLVVKTSTTPSSTSTIFSSTTSSLVRSSSSTSTTSVVSKQLTTSSTSTSLSTKTTSTSTTSSKSSTQSPTPTPTPTCKEAPSNKTCVPISSFSDQKGCSSAEQTLASNESVQCKAWWSQSCVDYVSVYKQLKRYCQTCGASCNRQAFIAGKTSGSE